MVRLVLEGVDAFAEALKKMPDDFAARAHGMVYTTAETTVGELHGAYPPRRPGSRSRFEPLQQVWYVESKDRGPLHPRAKVAHREILADWREHGTKPRTTKKGWWRGHMLPAPVFVPIVVRNRRILNEALVQLAGEIGLTVTGG